MFLIFLDCSKYHTMAKTPAETNKAKMLPSHEIYNRIIWDKRLNPNVFVFGYADRMSKTGIKEKPLIDWDADGDIPWHRIRYIRCTNIANTIVWDRDKHIDLFSSQELPDEVWQTKDNATIALSQSTPIFSPELVYHYQLVGWQAYHKGKENVSTNNLSIVTFNLLSDMYEADKIYTEQRIPVIIEHLKNALADVLVLQEVTKPLFEKLLKEEWLRDYFSSEAPDGPTLKPQNCVIFSKIPFKLVSHWYSTHKRALVASLQIDAQELHIAGVHLTSDHTVEGNKKRANQLTLLLNYLVSLTGDSIIAGDFNIKDEEHDQDFLDGGFQDLWKLLRPKEEGYTFNPEMNSLAKIMSPRKARLDRIFLRSKSGNWQAQEIEMFATKPFDKDLFASDHFALKTILRNKKTSIMQNLQNIAPIYQSAIVIIPPKELWPNIQEIRKLYDKKIDRWMPHITLIYGFIPEEYFEQAAELISQVLSSFSPFTVNLRDFKTFSHRKSATAWLEPISNPSNALVDLQAALQKLFPKCDEQSNKASGFTPHLSVGQFDSASLAIKSLPAWQNVDFKVSSVALISRRGNEPFEVRYEVNLGEKLAQTSKSSNAPKTLDDSLRETLDALSPKLSKEQKSKHEAVLGIIKEACKDCLLEETSLYLIGSTRLGVQNQNSDLDVVCIIPDKLTGQEFVSQMYERLSGLYQQARIITSAQVPILKLKIDDVPVDLLYARSSLFPFSMGLDISAQKYFDPNGWQTLVGCLEADILLEIVSIYVDLGSFREFLRIRINMQNVLCYKELVFRRFF